MHYGILNFNRPVDTLIEDGLFHVPASSAFDECSASPIGITVIGVNPAKQTVDTVATVVETYPHAEAPAEHPTVFKLAFNRIAEPVPLTPEIWRDLAIKLGGNLFDHSRYSVALIPETLGTRILQQACPNPDVSLASTSKINSLSDRQAEIRQILGRDDLSADAKVELIQARDGLGKFGDTVWARDIEPRFDLECIWDEHRVVHVRPWHASTDAQRIDPDNGLLLPSEIADAFENGYVTFDAEGNIVVSGFMMRRIWGLDGCTRNYCRAINLNRGQHGYMHYHRLAVYQHWLSMAV